MTTISASSDPMRILVTGGAGFIGSHLCERLVDLGHDVLCVDDYFTGSKENVRHLLEAPNFELLRHDIREPLSVEVERIYNLACPASPARYQLEPVRTVETSVLGAINMLRLARDRGAIMLQASTSEVYGDPQVHPQVEGYWGHVNPIGPRACYDEGKRCAEALCVDYRAQYGCRTRIARIFNTYGPRLQPDDGRVISSFIVQALRGQPLTVYGEGNQTRSFCYVDDMVDGLIALMDAPDDIAGPVNLGNPGEFTVMELADLVLGLTGSRSTLQFLPMPIDDPVRRRPDIGLARRVLGWQPKVDLENGLKRTIPHFEKVLGLVRGAA